MTGTWDCTNQTVQPTTQTRLTGVLACQDLQLGDSVRGQGQIKLAMPGVLVATQLVMISPPNREKSLRVRGFVTTTDCATGALQLQDDGTTINVQLSSATVITGRGQALTCADIQAGDRLEGLGQVGPDGSTIDAVRITITGPWLKNAMRP